MQSLQTFSHPFKRINIALNSENTLNYKGNKVSVPCRRYNNLSIVIDLGK